MQVITLNHGYSITIYYTFVFMACNTSCILQKL